MSDYDTCVFIGRFQPIHQGHLETIKSALRVANKLILVIGSYKMAPSTKNPWTAQERVKMILSCLNSKETKRIHFVFIRDRIYDETLWRSNVALEVSQHLKPNSKTALIGYEKDTSSYYLKQFPQWSFLHMDFYKGLNSTDFRGQFFLSEKPSYEGIPLPVKKILMQYRKSKKFKALKSEFEFEKETKSEEKKSHCIFLCSGYLWLLKKKTLPGKNLFCLPSSNKEIIQSQNALEFPKIEFDSQKYHGQWVLLDDLYEIEDKFFSDHFQIISHFLRKERNPSCV